MKTKDENAPVEVFAGSLAQVGLVKSLLENAEIEVFLKDEILGTLNPWWTSPGGAGAISVFVAFRDFQKAKIIIYDYEKNINCDE